MRSASEGMARHRILVLDELRRSVASSCPGFRAWCTVGSPLGGIRKHDATLTRSTNGPLAEWQTQGT
jgi:hypothetical protein